MTQSFTCGVLGRGSFGRVYRGEWVEGTVAVQVAVKRLDPESFQGQEEWMVSLIALCRTAVGDKELGLGGSQNALFRIGQQKTP